MHITLTNKVVWTFDAGMLDTVVPTRVTWNGVEHQGLVPLTGVTVASRLSTGFRIGGVATVGMGGKLGEFTGCKVGFVW